MSVGDYVAFIAVRLCCLYPFSFHAAENWLGAQIDKCFHPHADPWLVQAAICSFGGAVCACMLYLPQLACACFLARAGVRFVHAVPPSSRATTRIHNRQQKCWTRMGGYTQ
eukprot:scaffold29083_cov14-Tisochrysis_lutea.AAC.1